MTKIIEFADKTHEGYDSEDAMICPHCNYEHTDEIWETVKGDGDKVITTCENCDKKFEVILRIKFIYSTSKNIVKCDYCENKAEKTRNTPIVADMGHNFKMCEVCWGHERETIKGTYGRDIGGFLDNQ